MRVAFVGAGNMAREHIRAFADIPGVELAGIYSRTRRSAAALASEFAIKEVCESIAELYSKTSAGLLVIAVPELAVREVSEKAFHYSWVCLIEKPAGYDVSDAEAIAASAQEQRCTAFVALNRRHYSSTRAVLDELSVTEQPRLIHVYDQEDQLAARSSGQPELVIGNWMYANSVHVVDYLRVLGRGDVVRVEPYIRWNPAMPRFVAAKITLSSGDIGLYEAIWNGPGPWAVTVTTQEKRWELRPLERAASQSYGSRKLEPIAVHEWDAKFKPGLRLQAQEAVQAALGLPHSLPTLASALESMRLVQAIYGDGY